MKILFLVGDYPSLENPSASIFIHNQVKTLQMKDIQVTVLLTDIRSIRKKRKYGYSKYMYDGVQIYRYAIPCGPIPFLDEILSKIAAQAGIKKVFREFGRPDIIHCHFTLAGYSAQAIKRKYGIPYILTEHNSTMIKNKIKYRLGRIAKISYNNSDRLIAVGSYLKSKMIQYTSHNILVLPNIIPPYFKIGSYKKYEKITFITVGQLITRKRMDLTISAFIKLRELFPDIELKVVGTGPLLSELRNICKKLNAEQAIEFLGFCNNEKLPELYSKCHCFVLPSEAETFGVVYAEAAACGIPVIATNCGGPSDIVNQSNGLLIQKDNEQELIRAMKHVIDNIEQYDAQQISKDVISKFGQKYISKELIEIYNGVLNLHLLC
ncbi:MAG TPA: glycosyltransferase [Candidatus Paceibacterota bacterium]